jgi:hypothetical protein
MDEMLSLSDLQDVVLPAAPPLWPPAPGFWVLLLLAAVLAFSLWRWRRLVRQGNAYRRAGLALLADARSVHEVSVTLKRVALAAWPRDAVASLHDAEWSGFLNDSCRDCHFDADAWNNSAEAADHALLENASLWIRKHTGSSRRKSDA